MTASRLSLELMKWRLETEQCCMDTDDAISSLFDELGKCANHIRMEKFDRAIAARQAGLDTDKIPLTKEYK